MIDIYAYTAQGGRAYNEDSVGYAYTPYGAVAVAADGLGGHMGGDVASKLVTDALLAEPLDDCKNDKEWLKKRLDTANQMILDGQAQRANKMKSTVAALKISGTKATWAHLGDSRLYYLTGGRIACVTEDHSVAYKKYKAGEITRAQIATDEDQSSLLRSLGVPEKRKPDFGETTSLLTAGDAFLLCTDGFWENIQDQEILFDYLKAANAQTWAELLLLRVIERMDSGNDNLSVITVLIR